MHLTAVFLKNAAVINRMLIGIKQEPARRSSKHIKGGHCAMVIASAKHSTSLKR
jgi:hypothetical protein